MSAVKRDLNQYFKRSHINNEEPFLEFMVVFVSGQYRNQSNSDECVTGYKTSDLAPEDICCF